jgi:hypothetical protein
LNLWGYLATCEAVYVEALELLKRSSESPAEPRVLDAGGSFGALALALAALRVPVATCESFRGLGGAATILTQALEDASVEVLAGGTAADPRDLPFDAGFDLMICIALQSRSGYAEMVAAAASRLIRPPGALLLGVANAQYWPRRLHEIRRRAAPAFESAIPVAQAPFTKARLRMLLRENDLCLRSVGACNCSPRGLGGPKQQLASDLVMRLSPSRREVLIACASRSESPRRNPLLQR